MTKLNKVDGVKRSRGYPAKTISDKDIIKIEAWANILNHAQIADRLGMSHVTFTALMERDPRIALSYKKGLAETVNKVGSVVLKAALGGDLTACFFYLKTRAGWRETKDVNFSNDDGSLRPVKQIIVKYEDNRGNNTTKMVNAIEGQTK